MRLIDPTQLSQQWNKEVLPKLRRSNCLIRTGRFRGRTMQTTYTTTNNPGISAAILSTNRRIHDEAVEVLYGSYTFDFSIHVEAITPFLADLTNEARQCVQRVGLVKRALPYDRDFDCEEWRTATSCIASSLPHLRHLDLGVVAGKPGQEGNLNGGWDDVEDWTRHDFETWTRRGWMGLEWVRDLAKIQATEVSVRAVIEHCPQPKSEMMVFWVGISKSVVEGGFGEWIKELIRIGDAV